MALGNVVPASGATCSTVVDGRLQVRAPYILCQCGGSLSVFFCDFGSLSTSSFVAPSAAAAACDFSLEGDNKFFIHSCELHHDYRDGGHESATALQFLAMYVAKFAMTTTVSWLRYPLYWFEVALCATP